MCLALVGKFLVHLRYCDIWVRAIDVNLWSQPIQPSCSSLRTLEYGMLVTTRIKVLYNRYIVKPLRITPITAAANYVPILGHYSIRYRTDLRKSLSARSSLTCRS